MAPPAFRIRGYRDGRRIKANGHFETLMQPQHHVALEIEQVGEGHLRPPSVGVTTVGGKTIVTVDVR